MQHHELFIAGFLPVGLLLAGIGVLWWSGARNRVGASRGWTMVLWAIGAFLFLVGLLSGLLVATQFLVILILPVVFLVMVFAVRRYYLAEQDTLLLMLFTAAERNIPLDEAARSFSQERGGTIGSLAAKLADFLEAGVPLGLALQRSGHPVDQATALAADLGYQTGNLAPALRQVMDRSKAVDAATVPLASRLVYVGLVVVFVLVVHSFLLLRILPTYARMFREFEYELPVAAERLTAASHTGTAEWMVSLAVLVLGLSGLAVGVAWLSGFSLRRLPLIRRLWWRIDSSWVLRWLAIGVRQGRPMLDSLRLLAGYFPQNAIRRVLERSANKVAQGGHWGDGLLQGGVIGRRDLAILRAAERAGNLPWALEEVADSAVRRWVYRVQFGTAIAFPVMLILLGMAALAIVLGAFTPLVSLIQGWA